MNSKYEQTKNGLIVRLPSEIDHHAADEIRREVDKKIELNGISNLIFDFENTSFMDSSGIGLLLGRYKMVHYLGGNVTAIHVSAHLFRTMKLAGIQKLITIKGDLKKEERLYEKNEI